MMKTGNIRRQRTGTNMLMAVREISCITVPDSDCPALIAADHSGRYSGDGRYVQNPRAMAQREKKSINGD